MGVKDTAKTTWQWLTDKTKTAWRLLKDNVQTMQAIISIIAVLAAGWWAYNIFVKERRAYPHANIDLIISHVPLSKDINLLRVAAMVTNTGTSRLVIEQMETRVQQVYPILPCTAGHPCAVEQVNQALREMDRKEDRFSWPLIGKRTKVFDEAIDIEPTERDQFDFEFVIASNVTTVRIYSYVRNEEKSTDTNEVGWLFTTYYKVKQAGE